MKQKTLFSSYSVSWLVISGCLFSLPANVGCQQKFQTQKPTISAVAFDPEVKDRGWNETTAHYQNVAVKHDALYLKGPYETTGGDNVYDKLTREDLKALVICPGDYLINVATWPVALCRQPPWTAEYSRSIYPQEPAAFEPMVLRQELSPHESH